MLTLLLLMGCHDHGGDDSTAEGFDERVDVLVIGAGPAGVAAALSAQEAGASVLVLDRSSSAGDGIGYATRLFAAGSAWQAQVGVEDSVDQAAEAWEGLTGVSGYTPSVQAFLQASAPTLEWLSGYGVEILGVAEDGDAGDVARMHQLYSVNARDALLAPLEESLRLQVQVDELVVEDGVAVGARWTDLQTAETGSVGFGAVVVATGGFLRDRPRVDEARPTLAGRRLLFETNPHADGSGLAFLDALSPAYDSLESVGVYVHAIQDPELAEGEALVLGELDDFLIVDEAGARFADEGKSRSFDFFDLLPEGEVFGVLPEIGATAMRVARAPYNSPDPDSPEYYLLPELETLSDEVFVAGTPEELGALAGIDPAGLAATLDEVEALTAAGETDAFGRSFAEAPTYAGEVLWAVRLTPGLAKAFGGVATDLEARLLDGAGQPIPGVFVAGELAGMIPGGGAGAGFAGSVNACYYGGRVAGAGAASRALGAGD